MQAQKNGNYYWDKVVLPDGRKGYVARDYIEKIADVTNCNDKLFVTTTVFLRNGPGTVGTSVVSTLTKGQAVTRIERDKYNVDGYVWGRVKLSDGREGYIAQNYIAESLSGETKTELIKVTCRSGLKIRELPGTDQKILTYVDKDAILTRTEAEVSNANGYIWDKVVTSSGIEGYIARGDSREQYVEVIASSEPKPKTTTEENFKIQDQNLLCEPKTTIEVIKEKNSNKTVTVKDSKGKEVKSGNIGTGYTITIDKTTYTVVKFGDASGDGKISSSDLLKIQKHLLNVNKITDANFINAADVTKDGKISSADLLKIQKYLLDVSEIAL